MSPIIKSLAEKSSGNAPAVPASPRVLVPIGSKPPGGSVSQSVANPATTGSSGEVSQLSQSQPEDFPVDALPDPVRPFVLEAATALAVDPALVAGPCLAAMAGCIGNRRRIFLKPGWTEPAILWVAIVQRSGGKKTPAIKTVLRHLAEREIEMRTDSRGAPTQLNRLLVSDITAEALLSIHASTPLGLLLYRDELGGWFNALNQYKPGGKGSDAQTWTEMHQAGLALVDRKTNASAIVVPRATVSIIGGIQPNMLQEKLARGHCEDGIGPRLLLIATPERLSLWTEATISKETQDRWNSLLDQLLALEPDREGIPVDLPLTPEAQEEWVDHHDTLAMRIVAEKNHHLCSVMSKLKGTSARFALVHQLGSDPRAEEVTLESVQAAIKLSKWFENQARHVYSSLEDAEKDRELSVAHNWIVTHGGRTTLHAFANAGPSALRKRAREVLDKLVTAGKIAIVKDPGRRADEYICVGHE